MQVEPALGRACLSQDFLKARVELDEARLRALDPTADIALIRSHLETFPRVCAGGADAGPNGKLSQKERWHWLVAPRSTMVQVSAVHSGLCESPPLALERVLARMVRQPNSSPIHQ
ncbi:MAG: DUF3037 domain-containing protein [Myxococcota bacterium]|nr:DUF3037 domain-containing protein [Myxococcota bacterium]